ncbi:transposase [Roseomonas mucosa]|uniref:transposase n=1 Tax=Roseomonas mucosa TaxID=207340 RepID=UPI003DA72978
MSNPVERVEIITSRERRRRYSAAGKVRLVEEAAQPGMTVSAVARLHGVSPSLLFGWRRRMAEGGPGGGPGGRRRGRRQPCSRSRGQGPRPGAPARPQDHGGRDPREALEAARGKKPGLRLPSLPPAGSR